MSCTKRRHAVMAMGLPAADLTLFAVLAELRVVKFYPAFRQESVRWRGDFISCQQTQYKESAE